MQLLGGSFKWLLYGDDDTQWFTDGVLKLVKDLDYDLPYFVTGELCRVLVDIHRPPHGRR